WRIQERVIVDQRSFNICEHYAIAPCLLGPEACAFERFDNAAGLFLFSAQSVSREQTPASRIAFRKLRACNLQHVFTRMLCGKYDAAIQSTFELFVRPKRLLYVVRLPFREVRVRNQRNWSPGVQNAFNP